MFTFTFNVNSFTKVKRLKGKRVGTKGKYANNCLERGTVYEPFAEIR